MTPDTLVADAPSPARSTSPPLWPIYAVLFASTSVLVGVLWDISWHMSIGRDTFWTPAHLAIYLGGIVAGFACGGLVLHTSFAEGADRSDSVRFWRVFYGPLGAWVCIWGALAMITSAPFDDWWHNAYGLDVEVLSPPHVVLAAGIIAIQLGAMLMVLSRQNRAPASEQRRYGQLYAYATGLMLVMVATVVVEYSYPNHWHAARFYKITAGVFPIVLVATARAGRLRWPATTAALVYFACVVLMNWTLQLFPATPMLAPVYNNITHMVRPEVPLLLVAPAFAIDWIMRRWPDGWDWILAAVLGVAFVGTFVAVQWVYGDFMLSEGARNFVFGGDQWGYQNRPGPWRYEFWGAEANPVNAASLAFASGIAFVSARVGLWWGNWMSRVCR